MVNKYSFKGKYSFSIDSKGRIMLPSKFRKQLNTIDFVLIPSYKTHIILYPLDAFERFEEKINGLLNEEDKRTVINFIYSNAHETQMDSQGRINIPKQLAKDIMNEEQILIIGQADRLELWKIDDFEKYMSEVKTSKQDILKSIGL